ncbi:MAG: hypothetical protein Q7S26_02220 [bacterium]|nr:hypothetical protein [bacterium]
MNIKTFSQICASLLVFGTMLSPVLVVAQTDGSADVNAAAAVRATDTGTTDAGVSATATASVRTKAMTTAVTRADKEIARRIASLDDANARVQAMQQVTPAFKTSLSAAIQAQIAALTTLQTKIDADTDLATLKTDVQSVTKSYRIYALVLPQVRIAAAADRAVTLATMMNTLGAKLQARIASAGSAGLDTTALSAALEDMGTKLSDASSQAQAAVSATASLVPDNGDKTVMASNAAAFKTARKDLQTAQQNLVAARKDVTAILKGLKVSTTATTTNTVQ